MTVRNWCGYTAVWNNRSFHLVAQLSRIGFRPLFIRTDLHLLHFCLLPLNPVILEGFAISTPFEASARASLLFPCFSHLNHWHTYSEAVFNEYTGRRVFTHELNPTLMYIDFGFRMAVILVRGLSRDFG